MRTTLYATYFTVCALVVLSTPMWTQVFATQNLSFRDAVNDDTVHVTLSYYPVAAKDNLGRSTMMPTSTDIILKVIHPGSDMDSARVSRTTETIVASPAFNSITLYVSPSRKRIFDASREAVALRAVIDSVCLHVPVPTIVPLPLRISAVNIIAYNEGAGVALRYLKNYGSDHSSLPFKVCMITPIVTASERAMASDLRVPVLVLGASRDCVAPPPTYALPLYAACVTSNRLCVILHGADHCHMYADSCTVSDTACAATMTNLSQRNNVKGIVSNFLTESPSFGVDTSAAAGHEIYSNRVNGSQEKVYTWSQYICPGDSVILDVDGKNTYLWLPDSVYAVRLKVAPKRTTVYSVIDTSWHRIQSSCTVHVGEARFQRIRGQRTFFPGDSTVLFMYLDFHLSMPEWSTGENAESIVVKTNQLIRVRLFDSLSCSWWSDSVLVGWNDIKVQLFRHVSDCHPDTLITAFAPDSSLGDGYTLTWFNGSHTERKELDSGLQRVWFKITRKRDGATLYSDTVVVNAGTNRRFDKAILTRVGDQLKCSAADAYVWFLMPKYQDTIRGNTMKITGPGTYVVQTYFNNSLCHGQAVYIVDDSTLSTAEDGSISIEPRSIVVLRNGILRLNNTDALVHCKLLDVNGRCLWSGQNIQPNESISLNSVTPGVYVVECHYESHSEMLPVLVLP